MNVESASTIATIATLTTTLAFMQGQLAEINTDIRTLSITFASKEELMQTAKDTESRLNRLEAASNLWRWLSPSLAATLGAVLAVLIVSYLQHH